MNHMDSHLQKRSKVALIMVVLIASFYLLREYWKHVVGLWPYLILLLCPLLHLFHSHDGHGSNQS